MTDAPDDPAPLWAEYDYLADPDWLDYLGHAAWEGDAHHDDDDAQPPPDALAAAVAPPMPAAVVAPPRVPIWHTRHAGEIMGGRLVLPPRLCERLDLGPGRPSAIIGGPGAGKSDAAQSLALAVATGRPLWGRWPVRRGRVLYLTYDMGFAAVSLRFRRLANGMGVTAIDEGALELDVMPDVRLTTANAKAALIRRIAGFSLVVLDNLRDATPGEDENASSFGRWVTLFGEACAGHGATGIFLHHSGKGGTGIRGTGAIIGAAGCMWQLEAEDKAGPRHATQLRMSDVASHPCEPFWIVRHELQAGPALPFDTCGEPSWRDEAHEGGTPPLPPKAPDERETRVLEAIRSRPGLSRAELRDVTKVRTEALAQIVAALESYKLIEVRSEDTGGPTRKRTYWPVHDPGNT